jgi:hypothetical protein
MKKTLLILISTLALAGCMTTVPVHFKFPDAPQELMAGCPKLSKIAPGTVEMSKLLSGVTENYSKYHECRELVNAWIEWQQTQKQIYESVNK